MPIISQIGRRSSKVRTIYVAIFTVLTLGAATMIYPFLLMIAGSFNSEVDNEGLSLYPSYWFDDAILYQKYLEGRYAFVDLLEQAHQIAYGSWRRAAPL